MCVRDTSLTPNLRPGFVRSSHGKKRGEHNKKKKVKIKKQVERDKSFSGGLVIEEERKSTLH
jgi:hypothetical protein